MAMAIARFWMIFGAVICVVNGYDFFTKWIGEEDIRYGKLFLCLGGALLVVLHWLEIKQLKKKRPGSR
ncbi:hypothetical protein [Paenibacillus methanolicus]|uniref:Uncharacterized protein n=1 Tax=Paenibacillus methanolicus TaxID=582686 RepID=A0A5S5BWS2_9BACL|nr:hypothetical protein [Paenibacillus methanolicus]TYP70746.1 hypothetical protein BCM02_111254 [Paenibacillus methanolicus]